MPMSVFKWPAVALLGFVLSNVAISATEVVSALSVSGVARETPPGAPMGAAYLILHNGGSHVRRLQSVELPSHPEAAAGLHTTVSEDGVSRMRALSEVVIPAHGKLEMAPGGMHLMLHGVRLQVGEVLPLRLHFASGEVLDVSLPVESVMAAGQHQHGQQHGQQHDHHHG